jgi:repressor LexA
MTRPALTDRRRLILDFIVQHSQDNGYPPTVREIGAHVGLSSSSSVHFHLKVLEQAGYLKRHASLTRALRPTIAAPDAPPKPPTPAVRPERLVPVVGRVAAGAPILATENIDELLPMPQMMFDEPDLFMLEVKGDSMVNAGILDGDYLIVQCRDIADDGDIVVALLEDEATVKRFYRHRDHVELRPENDQMEPIRVSSVQIAGLVRGVLRRFR